MRHRSAVSTVSALVVLAGAAFLTQPAAALGPCSDAQIDYAFTVLDSVCGEGAPGTVTITCTGASVKVNSVECAD